MNATTAHIPASSLTAQSLRPEDNVANLPPRTDKRRALSRHPAKFPLSKLMHDSELSVTAVAKLLGNDSAALANMMSRNRFPRGTLEQLVDLFGFDRVLAALNARNREIHKPRAKDATDLTAFLPRQPGRRKGGKNRPKLQSRRRAPLRAASPRPTQPPAPQGMTPPPEVAVLTAPPDGHVLAISTFTDGKLVAMDAWLASLNVDQTLRVLERVRELDAKVRARLSAAMDDVLVRVEAAVGPLPPAKQGH
jgi:hypothetical protein